MERHDEFTKAYLECSVWSSTDDSGKPLDTLEASVADDTLVQMVADCQAFQEANAELLERWYTEARETPGRAGHDFWLTRNRHGAGYWDRWSSGTHEGAIGRLLTDAAHAYGSYDLYVGDDGEIHGS